MGSDTDPLLSDQSLKSGKLKTRVVSSRFLSPISSSSHDNRISSPTPSQASSPVRLKSSTKDTRKHRSFEDSDSGSVRGLWPSSIASSSPSHPSSNNYKKNLGTLADHLGNDRLKDLLEKKEDEKSLKSSNIFSLTRQRSCSEYNNRFQNDQKEKEKEISKENHRSLGGSMRYTGKFHFPGKSSPSLSSSSSSSSNILMSNDSSFVPGRLSVDENALYRNSMNAGVSRRQSDSFMNNVDAESECSASDCSSSATGKSSRKSGIEVSSKYLQDVSRIRTRRAMSDSNIQHPVSLDSSQKMKRFTIKNAIKRANSLTSSSQWALSPGRSGSPPMSVENKERPLSFSSLKPPSRSSTSTSTKRVEKLFNLGLDLFKGKKSSSAASCGNVENIHQLRLLHNRQIQWRYAIARAEIVKGNTAKQAEKNLLCAWNSLGNLQLSVLLKKLQLHKEKFEMKLVFILHSQIKQLEAWGDMERQHLSAVFKTNECLHSFVSKVPLIEGAKVEPHLTSIALRHASDLAASIKSALTACSPLTEKNAVLVSQLAVVVSQEKLLLEECLQLLHTIYTLQVQERSLKCYIIQLNRQQQQQITS